jgi:hypothetical protein
LLKKYFHYTFKASCQVVRTAFCCLEQDGTGKHYFFGKTVAYTKRCIY